MTTSNVIDITDILPSLDEQDERKAKVAALRIHNRQGKNAKEVMGVIALEGWLEAGNGRNPDLYDGGDAA